MTSESAARQIGEDGLLAAAVNPNVGGRYVLRPAVR